MNITYYIHIVCMCVHIFLYVCVCVYVRVCICVGVLCVCACRSCPFALLWLLVITNFRVTFFPYIPIYERPIGNLKFLKYFYMCIHNDVYIERFTSVICDILKHLEEARKYTKVSSATLQLALNS